MGVSGQTHMPEFLLKTKLHIPLVRRDLVPRARLSARLETGCAAHKLVVVAAPAGYGKTTLVAVWATDDSSALGHRASILRERIAWLSLDADDNVPERFLAYVVGALQMVEPSLGQDIAEALQSSTPLDINMLLTALVNQLDALEGELALVLDDYYLIHTLAIHQALSFLLEHAPPRFHLIILTRTDPLLPLARFRARGQLLELRQDDLRFTEEEAAQFLAQTMGVAVSSTDMATLTHRTEGWVAGLQMAGLSLQGHPNPASFIREFTGGHRYIMEFLLEEVLNQQTQPVQDFLIKTAMLERLNGPLCDAVIESTDAQAVLEYLEHANLFLVPLDDKQHWYRYHHLFADLLRQRLRRFAEPEMIAGLLFRAGAWHEAQGDIPEAVSYALAVADYARVTALVERYGLPLFYRGEILLITSWLKALPEAVIRAQPLLCVVHATCLVLTQQSADSIAQAEAWLDAAEAALCEIPCHDEIHDITTGFMLKLRAYLARFQGDPPTDVIALSRQALERLPVGNTWFRSALWYNLGVAHWETGDEEAASQAWIEARRIGLSCGDLFNALSAVQAQAAAVRARGRLRAAAEIHREALLTIVAPAERAGQSLSVAGILHVALGSIQVEWNDLEEAERSLTHGLALLALTSLSHAQFEGYFALARLKQALEEGKAARLLIEQAEGLYPMMKSGHPNSLFYRATAYLAQAKVRLCVQQAFADPRCLAEAEHWTPYYGLTEDAGRYDAGQFTLARLVIAQHRARLGAPRASLAAVLQFLNAQLKQARERDWVGWQIETLILQGLTYQLQGNLSPALRALEAALVMAEPERYTRVFLDEGPPLTQLLHLGIQREAWHAPHVTGYANVLLQSAPHPLPTCQHQGAQLVEPLSERELEVLRLLEAGLSNRQIADSLVVALGTIKTHVHNIYGKLGVERRTQAIARARELHLL
jgi:LuxR family transcriptional regulator, maltose regulon positive regulatory protein